MGAVKKIRRIFDLNAIHYRLILGWNYIGKDIFDGLKQLFYGGTQLYFDDGDVPELIQTGTIHSSELLNYVGITNPSTTHIAYTDNSLSSQSAEGDFETTEIATVDYQKIDADDANYLETTNPTESFFLYHKFLFESSIASTDAQRLRISVKASCSNASPYFLNGATLFAWDGTTWLELSRSTTDAITELTFSTSDAAIAQRLIDPIDNYVRIILRSRTRRLGAYTITLRTYYAEYEVNENLSLVIDLSHKAVLDTNDDLVSVRDITQGTLLELTTDYTISTDRMQVSISGQSPGDQIEVTYNRYFEVVIATLPEQWLSGSPSGDRERATELVLETVTRTKY